MEFKSNFNKAVIAIKKNQYKKGNKCNLGEVNITKTLKPDSASNSATALAKYDNFETIIKLWAQGEACLEAEYFIYKYLTPFLVVNMITPHVLIPILAGRCSVKQLQGLLTKKQFKEFEERYKLVICDKKHNYEWCRYGDSSKLEEESQLPIPGWQQVDLLPCEYVITPFIKDTLQSWASNKNFYNYYGTLLFQVIYTIHSYSKLGLRQNDLHTENIRIDHINKSYMNYKVGNKYYRITSDISPVIFDFDRVGIDYPASMFLEKNNIKVKTCTERGSNLCRIGQCTEVDSGKRDLWIFICWSLWLSKQNGFSDAMWLVHYLLTPFGENMIYNFIRPDDPNYIPSIEQIHNFIMYPEGHVFNGVKNLHEILSNKQFINTIMQYNNSNSKLEQITNITRNTPYFSYDNKNITLDKFDQFLQNYYK